MSITKSLVEAHVQLAPREAIGPLGCRVGRRKGISIYDLLNHFGEPHQAAPKEHWRQYDNHDLLDGAGKVSALWLFNTPRGVAELHDYWWNPVDVISINAEDHRATLWVHRYLDLLGLGYKESKTPR